MTNGFWAPFYRLGSRSLSCVVFAGVLIVLVTCETEKPFRPPKLVWICFQCVFSLSVSSQETAHSFSVYSSAGLGFGSETKHSLQCSVEGRAPSVQGGGTWWPRRVQFWAVCSVLVSPSWFLSWLRPRLFRSPVVAWVCPQPVGHSGFSRTDCHRGWGEGVP